MIYVIDHDPALCASLGWLLASVGLKSKWFGGVVTFIEQHTSRDTGCVLLTVRNPQSGGLEACEKLISAGVTLPLVVVTAEVEVADAVRAIKMGVTDLLQKPFSDEMLLASLRRAIELNRLQGSSRPLHGIQRREATDIGGAAAIVRNARTSHEAALRVAT